VALKTYGPMAVDWEDRIDFDRLRRERLARAKALLAKSEMGALLCFDMNNVRYITSTHIGTWAQDKISRFTLLPQNDEPILWDFGSAARHHQLHCPWLGERSRAGIPLLRGAMSPEMGRAENVAANVKVGIVLPSRQTNVQRRQHHHLLIARNPMQLGDDARNEFVEWDGAVKNHNASNS